MSVEDLVKDLRRQVSLLEDDLRVRAEEVSESVSALREEYAEAKQASRSPTRAIRTSCMPANTAAS